MSDLDMIPAMRHCKHCDAPCYGRFCSAACAEAAYVRLVKAVHRLYSLFRENGL